MRPMNKTVRKTMATLVFFWAAGAHAQFGNRALGISGGYLSIAEPSIEWGVPVQLESSLYLEDGWESTFRVPLMVLSDRVLKRQVLGTGANVGLRYLLTEETVRLYVGAELTWLYIFRESGQSNYFGLAPNVGADVFVSDTVSIGARGTLNVYLALNSPVRLAPGGQLVLAVYF